MPVSADKLTRRVCDSCHSRKVKCDRNDPCGNCLDQSTACTRNRGMRRLPKRDLNGQQRRQRAIPAAETRATSSLPVSQPVQSQCQSRQMTSISDTGLGLGLDPSRGFDPVNSQAQQSDERLDMMGDQQLVPFDQSVDTDLGLDIDVNFGLQSWMSIVPLTETQMLNQMQLDPTRDLAWTRRQALESALSVAGRILGSMEQRIETAADDGQKQRYIPSAEFLFWMLNDIGSDKFGSFISDYFRHVGKHDLRTMGMALLSNTASPSDSILYTVCVNSVAFKFLNATIGLADSDDDLAQRLSHSALLYRDTAKAALKQIPLMTKPSLTLLQALLCGTFLHQGSGDTNACRELAKTACRVAMDIGLHSGAVNMHDFSEAQYYCFIWCYMLDRNYAWKFGGARILQLEPDVVVDPPPHVTVSDLIVVYLDLAKVQDLMIPFLSDPSKAGRDLAFQPPHGIGILLLQKMEIIRHHINQIKPPSPNWTGLDPASEIATLDFAYHCILTNLLHLRQITLDQDNTSSLDNPPNQSTSSAPEKEAYLTSARHSLHALLTLFIATGPDRQKTIAYLHWTLLYYPLTACMALFCNAVATSHPGDFAMLSAVQRGLEGVGGLSPRVRDIQRLLGEFVRLCKGVFDESAFGYSADTGRGLLPVSSIAAADVVAVADYSPRASSVSASRMVPGAPDALFLSMPLSLPLSPPFPLHLSMDSGSGSVDIDRDMVTGRT